MNEKILNSKKTEKLRGRCGSKQSKLGRQSKQSKLGRGGGGEGQEIVKHERDGQKKEESEHQKSSKGGDRANWIGSRPAVQNGVFKDKKNLRTSAANTASQKEITLNKTSSRLCVKNLPNDCKEERLRKIFSEKDKVTDVKLIRRSDGKSRNFAFIGFKSKNAASVAKAYFDHSYIDTRRITVEFAESRNSLNTIRPWSKYSQGSSRHKENNPQLYEDLKKEDDIAPKSSSHPPNNVLDKIKEMKKDPKFRAFLGVTKNRFAAQFWDNDDNEDNDQDTVEQKIEGGVEEKEIKIENKKTKIDVPSQNQDDMTYLKSKQSGNFDSSDSSSDSESDTTDPEIHNIKTKTGINLDSGRLFIRNLSYTITEEELKSHFERFGHIMSVHLPLTSANTPKGFAFVQYTFPEDAVKAYQSVDDTIFQGRILHVMPAKPGPKSITSTIQDIHNGGYRRQKKVKQKKDDDEDNWNSLFIRQDTVVGATAARYGVSKGQLLDRDADNVAVRLALAETALINETKQFLKKQGVCMEAFNGSQRDSIRSNMVMLIKNIPFNCTVSEIRELFSSFGDLGRLVLPETRTMAIVEFINPAEAKKAFRALAYKKFKHVPLYLEWAPVKVFSTKLKPKQSQHEVQIPLSNQPAPMNKHSDKKTTSKNQHIEQKPHDLDLEASNIEDENDTMTLFVKNLNFDTKEKTLKKVFKGIEGFRSATIPLKIVKQGGKNVKLSMGYGFIEFNTRDGAKKALKTLQNYELEGHNLLLKLSRSGAGTKDSKSTKRRKKDLEGADQKECTKIVVKNVPFEATKRELRELFGAHGQIKGIRIPRKFDHSHRGFAFIDFLTKQEAMNAMDALNHTHLYGRHLVLQWARLENNPDEPIIQTQSLNRITAKQPTHKKQKKLIKEIDSNTSAFHNAFT